MRKKRKTKEKREWGKKKEIQKKGRQEDKTMDTVRSALVSQPTSDSAAVHQAPFFLSGFLSL